MLIAMAAALMFSAACCGDNAGDGSGPLSGKYTNAKLFSSIHSAAILSQLIFLVPMRQADPIQYPTIM